MTTPYVPDNTKRRLQFITPDGELIETGNSNDTFLAFVQMVGWERVSALNMEIKGEPLIIHTDEAPSGWYRQLAEDWYLNTETVNVNKIAIINKICDALGETDYHPSLTEAVAAEPTVVAARRVAKLSDKFQKLEIKLMEYIEREQGPNTSGCFDLQREKLDDASMYLNLARRALRDLQCDLESTKWQ